MQAFPHHYSVSAAAAVEGEVELTAERLPVLRSASPAEFGGPGDRWSPETFLVGAVADCFVLTFRAVARASKMPWTSLQCDVTGTLDRIDGVTQFTHLDIHAHLAVPVGTGLDKARHLLEKAERGCLVSNSLKAKIHLEPEVDVSGEPVEVLMGVGR
jgi:organic hydroperoxide reductase OsmC/OhrA